MGERQSVRVGIRGPAGRVSLAGDKPSATFSSSAIGCKFTGSARIGFWETPIPDRSPGHAFVRMPRMIHSLLIVTVGKSVWAKLLGTTSHGICFAWARIETLQYRRLEAGRRG